MSMVHSGQEAVIPTELVERLELLPERLSGTAAWDFADKYSPWGSSSTETILFVESLRGSLDAALGLLERTLPGWGWEIHRDDCIGIYYAWVGEAFYLHGPQVHLRGIQDTPALALCIAILKATTANSVDTEGRDHER